jgi:hypothetical protein
MKRCPTCNRTYEDDALSFCLSDGSSLIKDEPYAPAPVEPPPAVFTPPAPGDWRSSGPVSPPAPAWQSPPQAPALSGYQQPLPATSYSSYAPVTKQNGLAIGSLVCGIASFLCCSIVTGIPAIVLGIIALNKEKSDPARYGGKGMAIGGIVLGAVSILIFVVYLILAVAGALPR